jgi:hypothetical protein
VITRRVVVASLALVCAVAAGFYVAARPYLPKHPKDGIRLPAHEPSNAAWQWPKGVPGWRPGETYKGIAVANLQPIEAEAAELAAARSILDPAKLRVLATIRPDRRGALAVLAAPALDVEPAPTCLATVDRDEPVVWECPSAHHLSRMHVFGLAVVRRWPPHPGSPSRSLQIVGVARGDVDRITAGDQTLYTRGPTWGEFSGLWADPPFTTLRVYGHGRLLEAIRLPQQADEPLALR